MRLQMETEVERRRSAPTTWKKPWKDLLMENSLKTWRCWPEGSFSGSDRSLERNFKLVCPFRWNQVKLWKNWDEGASLSVAVLFTVSRSLWTTSCFDTDRNHHTRLQSFNLRQLTRCCLKLRLRLSQHKLQQVTEDYYRRPMTVWWLMVLISAVQFSSFQSQLMSLDKCDKILVTFKSRLQCYCSFNCHCPSLSCTFVTVFLSACNCKTRRHGIKRRGIKRWTLSQMNRRKGSFIRVQSCSDKTSEFSWKQEAKLRLKSVNVMWKWRRLRSARPVSAVKV